MSVIDGANTWYVSGAQSSIYIGNYLLDDALQVSFNMNTNPNPIYSAFDSLYRAVAPGQALVEGVIVTAFFSEGYMETLVNKFKEMNKKVELPGKISDMVAEDGSNENKPKTVLVPGGVSGPEMAISNLLTSNPLNGEQSSKMFNDYKRALQQKYWGRSRYSARTIPELYRTAFRLVLYYGDATKEDADRDEIFDVIIYQKSKQFDNSGAPINEVYNFVGKILI